MHLTLRGDLRDHNLRTKGRNPTVIAAVSLSAVFTRVHYLRVFEYVDYRTTGYLGHKIKIVAVGIEPTYICLEDRGIVLLCYATKNPVGHSVPARKYRQKATILQTYRVRAGCSAN